MARRVEGRGRDGLRRGAAALALALAAPALALAQPSADPIGDLIAPPPTTPAPGEAQTPVFVDQTGRAPPGQMSSESAYESRLRASFAAAQGLQGPLDGRWILAGPDGDLYAVQIVDAGGRPLEGAWRDLRRKGALVSTGFLSDIARDGSTLTFSFQPRGDGPIVSVALSPNVAGGWTGEMTSAEGRRTVSLRRD